MVGFKFPVDDVSPFISYSPAGAWTDSPRNDSIAQLYCHHTRHTTSVPGASATVRFNGTGIQFYGAKRPEYGTFNITIDGLSVPGNARSQNALYQQWLGGRSDLIDGSHTAVITNTGSAIDLDWIVFDTQIGSPNATITNTTIDDTSPHMHYLPTPKDWALGYLEGSHNDTHHYTQTKGAQAQFTFNGSAIAVYGTVSPEHAAYTVTVDGDTRAFQGGSDGLASSLHAGTLLYFANDLATGSHNLTLTASPHHSSERNTSKFADIDKIVVFNAVPPTHKNDSESKSVGPPGSGQSNQTQVFWNDGLAQGSSSTRTAHLTKMRTNVLIAGVIAGSLMLLVLVALGVALMRGRQVKQDDQEQDGHEHEHEHVPQGLLWPIWPTPLTPRLPMQTPPISGVGSRSSFTLALASKFGDARLDAGIVEKGQGYRVSNGPNQHPFMDETRIKGSSHLPLNVPLRMARPPTLVIPVKVEG